MKSFLDSLAERRLMRNAEVAFTMMAERGIDPNTFVEWLAREGAGTDPGRLHEKATRMLAEGMFTPNSGYSKGLAGLGGTVGAAAGWATAAPFRAAADTVRGLAAGTSQMGQSFGMNLRAGAAKIGNLSGVQPASKAYCASGYHNVDTAQCCTKDGQPVDRYGNPIQNGGATQPAQQVQSALQALRDLSRHTGGKPLDGLIHNLIGYMTANPQMPATQTAHYTPEGDVLAETFLMNRNIARVCDLLGRRGIDPNTFVEWYSEEGRHLQGEAFREGFGDFLGRHYAGFKNALSGSGGNFMSRWGQGAQQWQQDQDTGRFNAAAAPAVKALKELGATAYGDENFKANLQKVIQQLESPAPDPSAGPAATPPADPAASDPTAVPAPADPALEAIFTTHANAKKAFEELEAAYPAGAAPQPFFQGGTFLKAAKELLASEPGLSNDELRTIISAVLTRHTGQPLDPHHIPDDGGMNQIRQPVTSHYRPVGEREFMESVRRQARRSSWM